jgi:hypothetical protein
VGVLPQAKQGHETQRQSKLVVPLRLYEGVTWLHQDKAAKAEMNALAVDDCDG